MEEIVSAEAIKGEILDDASKKASRLLEEAEEESAKAVSAMERKAGEVVSEIVRSSEASCARFRMETLARLPLEKTRMRATFVEKALREALGAFMDGLPAERVSGLAETMLRGGAAFLSGKEIAIGRKGISETDARAVAERALSGAVALTFSEDPSIRKRGLVAAAQDGSVILRATMDIVEEKLLDESRSELAWALCGEALSIDAPVGERAADDKRPRR